MKKIAILLVSALPFVGCQPPDGESGAEFTSNARGLDSRNMDETVSACDDFYQYANGAWLARNAIPADEGSWGISDEMRERNYDLLREILEEAAAADAEKGTNRQKAGNFWKTGMDTAKIDAEGLEPPTSSGSTTPRASTSCWA